MILKVRHTEVCDTELLERVDLNSSFESIKAEGGHYDIYREETIRIGSNLVELYRTEDDQAVELDERAPKHLVCCAESCGTSNCSEKFGKYSLDDCARRTGLLLDVTTIWTPSVAFLVPDFIALQQSGNKGC